MASKSRSSDSRKANNVSQPPQWTEFLNCSICEKEFNRTDRFPISLACGHTVCRECLTKLKKLQCQYDKVPISGNIRDLLPVNSALLQLLPGDSELKPNSSARHHSASVNITDSNNIAQLTQNATACIEELALFLKAGRSSDLSRPMQRKLVTLVHCQLYEDEGRKRTLRACRALGERTATELILLHQNPTTLSASLWAAVRARGCQFLGPAMQEEALKLIHLALEDGSELSRKVLVQIVVKNLKTQFSQASKTSIGHVVQLLYRASCFKVTKRNGESSLMRLKEEFVSYDELRKEHDSQVVQIAREAGLRIAPDQWSALLYGDTVHKSYMQSIIDRLQSGASFKQCITDLSSALDRSSDPGDVKSLMMHFNFLSDLNCDNPSWDALEKCTYSAKVAVKELVSFMKNHKHWMWQCQDATQQTSKYKTSMCRDSKNKGICPRGQTCTFAHTEEELQHYRNRRKKGGQIPFLPSDYNDENQKSKETAHSNNEEIGNRAELEMVTQGHSNATAPCGHACHCGNVHQPYDMSNTMYFQGQPSVINNSAKHSMTNSPRLPGLSHNNNQQAIPIGIPQQVSPIMPVQHQQPPSQMQYVPPPGNHVVYEAKHQSAYEPIHHIVPSNQTHYKQNMPVGSVRMPSPSASNLPMHTAVVQQNPYMIQPQQNAGYCQLPGTQVPAQNVMPEPVIPSHQTAYVGPSYTCLTFQNGHQVAVPAARPEVLQQPPVLVQQQPGVPVQNLPANQVLTYQPNVIMQVAPHQQAIGNMVPPVQVSHSEQVLSNRNVAPAVNSLPAPEEVTVLSNPLNNYNQYCVSIPANTDVESLAELRLRKDEVINKLVQKRIVAPKLEGTSHQKLAAYYDIPDDNMTSPTSVSVGVARKWPVSQTSDSLDTLVIPSLKGDYEPATNCLQSLTLTSDGRYSLWTGTTCIPSLSGLSFREPLENCDQSSPTAIDVISDLDTRTSQVPAGHSEVYWSSYARSPKHTISMAHSCPKPHDDEIVSIQDQRIVSKYGPIARTVRSKTTSAIPEQVTANANGNTHPFPSDVNRNKSNFVADDRLAKPQSMLYIREVEPSSAESVNHRKLPDLISGSYQTATASDGEQIVLDQQSELTNQVENEDLLLAIELQQIEMGIQRIQRDTKSK